MPEHPRTGTDVSRYAFLTRSQARLILASTILFMALCLLAAPAGTLMVPVPADVNQSDVAIYRDVVRLVHSGQSYYDALGQALRIRRRATRSVFNWRTPLHLTLLALMPTPAWAQALLGIGGLAALLMGLAIMLGNAREIALPAVIQLVLMLGPFINCFTMTGGVFFAELWAGVLIAISIEAYAFRWWQVGVLAGILALFLRELALPYVMVSGLLAWRDRRREETIAWLAGSILYAVYFTLHALAVTSRLGPADIANSAGWVQIGGLSFILRTSSFGWFLNWPPWVAGLYLPIALLGLGGWPHPIARRVILTAAVYMGSFAMLGYSFNLYWGALYASLLTFGAGWSPAALRDLIRRSGIRLSFVSGQDSSRAGVAGAEAERGQSIVL